MVADNLLNLQLLLQIMLLVCVKGYIFDCVVEKRVGMF